MDFITSHEELRAHYKAVHEAALKKELPALDRHCRGFIARSPFVLIGSSDANGNADVTPKGDRPGFVAVLDDTTLAIPDRPGNNRLDTLENIVVNPAVGLLFLIPGMNETLRVNGQARITARRDAARAGSPSRASCRSASSSSRSGSAYMHCAKAFMRSDLWKPETWPDRSSLPTLGDILRDQVAYAPTAEEGDRRLDEAYRDSMW